MALVFKRASPSLVTVSAFDERDQQSGQGSGIAIGGERIVTNCHVVREAYRLTAASGETCYPATWVTSNPTRDLCVISAEGYEAAAASVRTLDSVVVGEPLFAAGNPLGFRLAVSAGLVAAVARVRGERVIVSTAPQLPGASGGGLFDAQGRLLGVITAIMTSGQNLNPALSAEWIAQLADRGWHRSRLSPSD